MVEGARLESVYTATYRGFESLPLRQYNCVGLAWRHSLLIGGIGEVSLGLGIPEFSSRTALRVANRYGSHRDLSTTP